MMRSERVEKDLQIQTHIRLMMGLSAEQTDPEMSLFGGRTDGRSGGDDLFRGWFEFVSVPDSDLI